MKTLRFLALLAALVGLAACGARDISKDVIAGTYSVSLTKADLTNAGAGFGIALGYDKSTLILELTPDGTYKFSEKTAIGIRPRSQGAYTLTADQLVFGEDSGDQTCSKVGVKQGTYKWSLAGDQLTLTAVDDPCEDRVYPMTALPWTRQP